MSDTKKRIETHAEKVMAGLITTAEKAAQESDIAELKKCFDGATAEVTQLSEVFDSMIRVMAMDNKGPPPDWKYAQRVCCRCSRLTWRCSCDAETLRSHSLVMVAGNASILGRHRIYLGDPACCFGHGGDNEAALGQLKGRKLV